MTFSASIVAGEVSSLACSGTGDLPVDIFADLFLGWFSSDG